MKQPTFRSEQVISVNTDGDSTTYILRNGAKLSEVFNALPAGIINKTETGIGATTLELKSARSSIIVEPIKVTASGKANKRTAELYTNPLPGFATPGAFYVGSETALHPNKLKIGDIKFYHRRPGYKKFVVVADSLRKVIDEIGPDVYTDYFLMVDEADSFQMDSTYRNSMNVCLDIFKQFPANQRALVTATMLEYSDPKINCLAKTKIQYETPTSHDMNLVYTDNLNGAAIDTLIALFTGDPDNKVLVAYNSPDECFNLATHLESNKIMKPGEQKILCSINSKKKAGQYFTELTSDILPGKINYITSAYFSGFDLHEDFHLISIADGGSYFLALSEHRLKQIAGRCRNTLLSQTVIYSTQSSMDKPYTKDELVEAGSREVQALKCIHFHYDKSPVLKENIMMLRNLLLGSEKGSMRYARVDIHDQPAVAYLNIDAALEAQRVRQEVYHEHRQLVDLLEKDGHRVSLISNSYDTQVADQKKSETIRSNETKEVMQKVRNLTRPRDVDELLNEKTWSPLQNSILRLFSDFRPYVDWNQLLNIAAKLQIGRDTRQLKNLRTKLFLSTYDENSDYKKRLSQYFKVGTIYSPKEQQVNWNMFLRHWDSTITVTSTDLATKLTAKHFKIEKVRSKGAEILPGNSLDITVLRVRKDEQATFQELLALLF